MYTQHQNTLCSCLWRSLVELMLLQRLHRGCKPPCAHELPSLGRLVRRLPVLSVCSQRCAARTPSHDRLLPPPPRSAATRKLAGDLGLDAGGCRNVTASGLKPWSLSAGLPAGSAGPTLAGRIGPGPETLQPTLEARRLRRPPCWGGDGTARSQQPPSDASQSVRWLCQGCGLTTTRTVAVNPHTQAG